MSNDSIEPKYQVTKKAPMRRSRAACHKSSDSDDCVKPPTASIATKSAELPKKMSAAQRARNHYHEICGQFRLELKQKLNCEYFVELPAIRNSLAKAQPKCLRIPKFLQFEEQAYDPETYQSKPTGHKPNTTVRWCHSKDTASGKLIAQSNAFLVTWEDKTQTLHVGDEVFELDSRKLEPVKNHWYLRFDAYYQRLCGINEQITLRTQPELSQSEVNK
ncbi:maker214 [Drosophila busckii]|uniref:Maker214 n=1 Tax=Drosophila busckii TaxID=30019 RepID=A0A0M3QY26_DROBS|nr:RNA polymerase-associated protein LEO1 [Drosophila busckii]ALC46889.1 maker214 [Drosophila busckii]